MNRVCGWLRVRDEIETIDKCLKSVENIFDYFVITHNDCTDGTDLFLKEYVKNKQNYFLYHYEYNVLIMGDERYKKKEYKYENSLAALYNFALSKVEKDDDYVFKIDGDMIYDSKKLNEVVTMIRNKNNNDVYSILGYGCAIRNNEILIHSKVPIIGKGCDALCFKKSFVRTFEQKDEWEQIKFNFRHKITQIGQPFCMNIDNRNVMSDNWIKPDEKTLFYLNRIFNLQTN